MENGCIDHPASDSSELAIPTNEETWTIAMKISRVCARLEASNGDHGKLYHESTNVVRLWNFRASELAPVTAHEALMTTDTS